MRLFHIRYWSLALGILLITLAQLPFNAQASQSDVHLLVITPSAEPATPIPPTSTSTTPDTPVPATNTPTTPEVPTSIPTETGAGTAVATSPPDSSGGGDYVDPAIYKSSNTSSARIGDTVIFTLHLTNLGTSTARDVIVGDSIPSEFSVVSASATRGSVSVDGQNVVVVVGDLPAKDNVYITIETRVNDWVMPGSVVNNVVVSTSSSNDPPDNNTSSTTITITEMEPTPSMPPTETWVPATPTVTPVPPAGLPNTSAGDANSSTLWLTLAGLLMIAISFMLYAYNYRTNKEL